MDSPGSTARKLTAKGAQSRQRIVVAAAELMFEQGTTGTTMDQVRAAAGVSSSQIYHYFVDKDALVRAVIQYQADTIVGGQEAMLANLGTLAGFRAWRDYLVEHQRRLGCRGGCPIGSLGREVAEVDPKARAVAAAGLARWEEGIRGGIRQMHTRGDLVLEADPDRLATTTLAALQGALLMSQLQRSTEPLETALTTVLDHLTLLTKPRPRT